MRCSPMLGLPLPSMCPLWLVQASSGLDYSIGGDRRRGQSLGAAETLPGVSSASPQLHSADGALSHKTDSGQGTVLTLARVPGSVGRDKNVKHGCPWGARKEVGTGKRWQDF